MEKYFNLSETINLFNDNILQTGLTKFNEKYFSRDTIVTYCIDNGIEISSEKYPSEIIKPDYKQYLSLLPEETRCSEDYEEYHNAKFINAFVSSLESLGYKKIYIYYECFDDKPYARCYEVKCSDVMTFLSGTEVPIYFLDDTHFFSSDFKYGLCLFHHEMLEFFGFGASAKMIHELTNQNIIT
jgi:hypothetical protein